MRLKIIILLICWWNNLHSQNEDFKWIFNFSSVDSCLQNSVLGEKCGASILDFNSIPPIGYSSHNITLDMGECNASICDENGELLLYSNGQSIHGPEHTPIVNGDTINFSPKWRWLEWQNEFGEWKPSGMRFVQCIGFINQPDTDTILALYHNYENYDLSNLTGYFELWQSKIVLNNQNEYEIVEKDILVNDKIYRSGAITACKHGNGRDWWVLQFNRDTVYHYLIDPHGFKLNNISLLPFELRSTVGQSKFDAYGNKFALYGRHDLGSVSSGGDLMIADFDRCDGSLINPKLSFQPGENAVISNGLEFSPDGSLLYISNNLNIFQFDLTSPDIFLSKQTVATYNGSTCGNTADFPLWFGQLQLGPDNKIYNGRDLQCFNIHVINNPNQRGETCDVQQNVIELPTYTYGTVPNFNTYRLGPLDHSFCDTLNLNNNPVSRFWLEQDSIDYLRINFWDVSYLRPEEWNWDFGDGTTSTERHPSHVYSQDGIYRVCLTVSNENNTNTSCDTLNLGMDLFPNPFHNNLRITVNNYLPKKGRLILYDISGKFILQKKIHAGANVVQLSHLNTGTYFYEILDSNKLMKDGKVIKI